MPDDSRPSPTIHDSTPMIDAWSVRGAAGEMIVGDCHEPAGQPAGTVLVAHGFKGFKDYGFLPRLAATLAGAGFVAHRFTFSHAGIPRDSERFERPDLFQRCTWNRLVEDLAAVIAAVRNGRLAGGGLPLVLVGHSRGGTACLLAAARGVIHPAGIAALAAPDSCLGLSADEIDELQRQGSIESPSRRTGQVLHVGRAFLDEQLEDPDGHDVLGQLVRITCPVLLVHGSRDETVPLDASRRMASMLGPACRLVIVEGANHVFNTAHPMPAEAPAGSELGEVFERLVQFARRACAS